MRSASAETLTLLSQHEEQSKGFQLDSALHHVKQLGLPLRTLPAAMIGLYLLGFIPSVYMLLAVTPGEYVLSS